MSGCPSTEADASFAGQWCTNKKAGAPRRPGPRVTSVRSDQERLAVEREAAQLIQELRIVAVGGIDDAVDHSGIVVPVERRVDLRSRVVAAREVAVPVRGRGLNRRMAGAVRVENVTGV